MGARFQSSAEVTTPDSTEFLDLVTSDKYREQQAEHLLKISNSYEVLQESPWIQSRPLFCFALAGSDTRRPQSYTLRVKLAVEGFEDELNKVFGSTIPDIASKFEVNRIVDGLVAFESWEGAESYRDALEMEGHLEVSVAEVDSHQLFRMVQDVEGVAVLLREGAFVPQPPDLKSALLGKGSLESF